MKSLRFQVPTLSTFGVSSPFQAVREDRFAKKKSNWPVAYRQVMASGEPEASGGASTPLILGDSREAPGMGRRFLARQHPGNGSLYARTIARTWTNVTRLASSAVSE